MRLRLGLRAVCRLVALLTAVVAGSITRRNVAVRGKVTRFTTVEAAAAPVLRRAHKGLRTFFLQVTYFATVPARLGAGGWLAARLRAITSNMAHNAAVSACAAGACARATAAS